MNTHTHVCGVQALPELVNLTLQNKSENGRGKDRKEEEQKKKKEQAAHKMNRQRKWLDLFFIQFCSLD